MPTIQYCRNCEPQPANPNQRGQQKKTRQADRVTQIWLALRFFEAKRQKAGICGVCSKMFATWTSISIGRRVTQVQKFVFRLRSESILRVECKKTLGIHDFHGFQVQSVTGSSFPLSHVSKHQRHSALGKAVPTESVKFRAPCLKAVKNVISPPHPHPLLSISEHVQHFNNDNPVPWTLS